MAGLVLRHVRQGNGYSKQGVKVVYLGISLLVPGRMKLDFGL